MLQRLFRPRPARRIGAALYEAATRQARRPIFYAAWGAPDTVEGRFELYSLHVILLLNRLRAAERGDHGPGDEAAEISQALFDAYLRSLDDALREMGVGDLSVGKKMRKLGEAFYGRAETYEAAFAGPDGDLETLIGRTVFEQAPEGDIAAMTDYVRRCRAALALAPDAVLMRGEAPWAEVET